MATRNEFLSAFWTMGFRSMSEIELDSLLSYIDDDRNGYITFQEFVLAAVHADDVLTPSKLLLAFKSFDKDGGGSI